MLPTRAFFMQQSTSEIHLQTLRSKTMKHFMVVIISLLVPATAMAKGECKEDHQKFCKDATHVGACLDQHVSELSEACKNARQAKGTEKKHEGSAKMGKEEGTHAEPGHGQTPESDTSKVDQPTRRDIPSNDTPKQ
jgi:hypothetical protein